MLNKFIAIGFLGQNPDFSRTGDGERMAVLSLATNETWKDKSGEKHQFTTWHRVVMFGNIVDIAEKYLQKGSKVYIEAKIRTRKWNDKEGIERTITEAIISGFGSRLVLLDSSSSSSAPPPSGESDYM